MPGTKSGGIKAREANYERHGKDFYRNIGQIGGSKTGVKKGFALNPEKARLAGYKGGRISRRGPGSAVATIIEPNEEKIEKMYYDGFSIPQIARHFDVAYSTLLKWAKANLTGYGARDDIERYERMLEYENGRNN